MNARIQQCLVGLKLLLSLLALLWGWRSGQAGFAVFLLALIFGFSGLVMLLVFAVLPSINRAGPAMPPLALLRAWACEWVAYERIFSWQQPFAEHRYPDYLPKGNSTRAVLLVHGFSCNRGLWNPWMRRLRAQGTPCVALTLEPAFGSIDGYAAQIESALQALARLGGPPPVIVAHSMGGLAVRAWLRRYGGSASGESRFSRVMSLGAPHAGTVMASFSPAVNARQMCRRSAWLDELALAESPELAARFSCYFSGFDQVVCPAETAVLSGSTAIEVAGSGHLNLLFEDRVFADLLQLLAEKKPC